MDKVMEKWNEILQMVKEEHGLTDVSFNTWIKPLGAQLYQQKILSSS